MKNRIATHNFFDMIKICGWYNYKYRYKACHNAYIERVHKWKPVGSLITKGSTYTIYCPHNKPNAP